MNNIYVKTILRFFGLLLLQGIIIYNVDINMYVHPMIYPLFILLLPIEINFYLLLVLAFTIGISVDMFSSTFGLNASSAVFLAYIRPLILKLLQPRDGYENIDEPNITQMGRLWFIYYTGLMILLHNLWFFSLEYLNFYFFISIIVKSILSGIVSLIFFIIFQYLFKSQANKNQ